MSDETVQPLPRKITSSHTLCADKSMSFHLASDKKGEERSLILTNNNNDIVKDNIPEEFRMALKHYREKDYGKAVELLEQCCDYYPPAQYQLACMCYDGLGITENHVSRYTCNSFSFEVCFGSPICHKFFENMASRGRCYFAKMA